MRLLDGIYTQLITYPVFLFLELNYLTSSYSSAFLLLKIGNSIDLVI